MRVSSLTSLTTELMRTTGISEPIQALPDGLMRLPLLNAATTSSGAIFNDMSRLGSTRTTTVRALPPNGGGAETPGRLANMGRTRNRARSWISLMLRVSLESTRNPTGTLPASKRITKGGTVPTGMNARERLT